MPNFMQVLAVVLAVLAIVGIIDGYDPATMQGLSLGSITSAIIGQSWPPARTR